MGDAWTILEDNVEDTYVIPEEQEHMILAWDEFRIETGIKVIGFPIWIDSFGVGIDDDNEVFRAQGYDDMPSWKQKFLRHNRKLYLDNRVLSINGYANMICSTKLNSTRNLNGIVGQMLQIFVIA